MLKRILISAIGILLFTSALFYGHEAILNAYILPYKLLNTYIFHGVFFIVAVLIIEVVYMLNPAQLGFSYLGVIFAKLGAFILVFNEPLFSQEDLGMKAKLSLVVPLLIYILIEAVYCALMLKKVDAEAKQLNAE